MCTDTIPVLAYVKIELFFADICYYQRINPKPITDMAKKIAEQLINTLAESGVERIYAVTGDSLNEVNEAVRKNNKIKWIHVRHEETGAYAAAAEAQLTGRPGCCAGSSGPGHVHLINGLYDAQRSGAPVIAIASTIPSGEFGTEYFQETNTIKLFNDCSYYNEVATTPKQFPRMLQSAIQTAITRKGVAVVGLPGDLAKASAVSVDSSVRNYFTQPEVCPSEEDLILLADLLNSHERITLFCGIGCRGAHEEVIALSEKLNAPVAYTFKGKMEVQYENPYEVGMTGLLGMPSGYYSMHEAEVLLMLGTDFPYSAFLPDDIKIAQIDIKPERLGRRAKVDIGLCGDVKMTIQALLRMLTPKTDDTFLLKQLKRYEEVKKDLAAYTKDKGEVNKIHPEYVMSEIDKLSSDDAVFTVDTGMTCVWGARYLQATGNRHMLGSFNHGSMANALPQAIGAALAYPERQVVALCGDGGLSMTLGDLATVVQYKLPIKIIVFNNRSLGMVKLEMEVDGLPDWQNLMKRQKNKIQQIDFTDKTKSFHAFPPHFQRRSHGKHKKLTFPSIRYELPGFITILAKSKHILMKALLLTGLLFILILPGCRKETSILPLLQSVEELIPMYADSASVLLDSIQAPDELTDKDFAHWCMLCGKVTDEAATGLLPIYQWQRAQQWFTEHGTAEEQAQIDLYLGRAYVEDGEYDKAMHPRWRSTGRGSSHPASAACVASPGFGCA